MFHSKFLLNYLSQAPFSLAFERYVECLILKNKDFVQPVLDIGCGEGLFASILFSKKIDVGIDPNSRELMRAEELGGYSRLVNCYGDNIDYADGSFNTIFSNSVLEHIDDLKPVLKEACRLLSKEGVFYATVPSDKFERFSVICTFLEFFGLNSHSRKFRSFYNSFWVHYHAYPLEQWRELFGECGFNVTESFTYAPHWFCFMNDLLVPTALMDKFLKSSINRWTLFKPLRRFLVFPFFVIMSPFLKYGGRCHNGGLIFIEAKVA